MTNALPSRRIVSLQPSVTVILDWLNSLDLLVACTRYCQAVCTGANDGSRLIVKDSWSSQATEIVAAQPDLVIASVPYQAASLAEILKAGTPVLALAPHSLADIYRDIAMIAGIIGRFERADAVIYAMQAEIEQICRTASQAATRPKVFCEEWGKPIIRSQPWVAELVEAAGGEFAGPPGVQTTAEEVLRAAPDVLVAAWCGAGDRVPLEKTILQRGGWQNLPASKSGRVFCISDELLNTPAPTLVQGLQALAWAIHPELFTRPKGIRKRGTDRAEMHLAADSFYPCKGWEVVSLERYERLNRIDDNQRIPQFVTCVRRSQFRRLRRRVAGSNDWLPIPSGPQRRSTGAGWSSGRRSRRSDRIRMQALFRRDLSQRP
jgi:iron complex transport system substrate-binding protein